MTRSIIAPEWVVNGYKFPTDVNVIYCDHLPALSDEEIATGDLIVIPYLESAIDIQNSLPRMKNVKVIQLLTAGYDNVYPHLTTGITVCNAAGVHDDSTSEMAVNLTLAALRDLPRSVHLQSKREWGHYFSKSLSEKNILLVGYGGVGKATEKRLLPFGCSVVPVATYAREHVRSISDLYSLIPDADIVVLTVPLNESTRGLVGKRFLNSMKSGALLVNVARGPVVETDALVDALNSGKICAALDVTDPEPLPPNHHLWTSPNCLITPHLGGETDIFESRARKRIHTQLDLWLSGQKMDCVISG